MNGDVDEMGRKRFIWEEIMETPAIFRICEAGSRENAYFIMSGGESLLVDPRSKEMMRSIKKLSEGLGAPLEKMQIFLTQGCTDASMAEMIESLCSDTVIYTSLSEELKEAAGADVPVRVTSVADGNRIFLGRKLLQCIWLEGHARGLAGLWLPEEGVLFSGDAVGCDYLPDVPAWDSRIDTFGLQIEMLRRLENLPLRLILPGHGTSAGLDEEAGMDIPRISNSCLLALEDMIGQYCIHILETYQQIPSRESVPLEHLRKIEREKLFREKGSSAGSMEDPQKEVDTSAFQNDPEPGNTGDSFRKYLLYRRYIRQKEDENGRISFERGSMLLTDWSLREE